MDEVLLVKATYDFERGNTDELSFRKGDVIIVTQKLDGGWWEGTLREETGWFPTSFVTEHRPENIKNGLPQQDHRRQYRTLVLKNLVDSERNHVADMQTFQRTYLRALKTTNVLPEEDYITLCGNIEEVTSLHSSLADRFDEIVTAPPEQQAVGGLLMNAALEVRAVHLKYCSNHPRVVQILSQYRETLSAFCETLPDSRGGVMFMTAELSRPFRRLDKYPNMLQELERHLEEFHPDRGNTQRAVMVYTEIAAMCAEVRRQKEIELEILNGNIKDYQGPEISTLGEVILMSQVIVRDEPGGATQERYVVLFEEWLLMLAASPRMSCFMYMSHSPLSGLKMRPVDTAELPFSFEIWSKTLDRKIIQCKTRDAFQLWLEKVENHIEKSFRPPLGLSNTLPKPAKIAANGAQTSPLKVLPAREAPPLLSPRGQRFKPPIITNPVWSGSCLRPYPPLRLDLSAKEEKAASVTQSPKLPRKFSTKKVREPPKTSKSEDKLTDEKAQQHENDIVLLGVIDAYCISTRTRHKVSSEVLDSPHVLIAEDEKIFIEGTQGNFLEEKSLVDTVYALKDEMRDMSKEICRLRKMLEEERTARRYLEISAGDSRNSVNGERYYP